MLIAASAHARAAIYTRLTRNYRVGLFGWMDGVYANEGLACVQTLLSTARESQIGTRCCEHARAAIYAGPKVDLFQARRREFHIGGAEMRCERSE